MISMDIVRAALLAVLPMLALVGHLPLWWIYVVLFLNVTLSIGFNAAGYAALASLVRPERLVQANGFIQASSWLSLVLGPLLAVLLLTRISLQGVLWVDAASFLVSAVSLAFVRTSFNRTSPRAQARSAFGRDLVEGLRYVLSHPLLRALGLIALLANLALGTIVAQLVLVAKNVFAASDAQVAVFATALGIGGTIASLLAGPLKRRLSYGVLLLGSLLLFGVLTIVLVLTRSHWAGVVLWGCMFGMIGFFDTAFPAIVQAIAPNENLGRVTTFIEMLAVLSVPLSAVLGGWIIDRVGSVALVFGILGGFVTLVALAFLGSPLAHVERYLPSAQPAEVAR
jgi:MFS family permease